MPFWPQESSASTRHFPRGSIVFAGTGLHSPTLPATLQATQAPSQARLQQTPSAQNPEAHWLLALQVAPRSRLLQDAPEQQLPETHPPDMHSLSQAQAAPPGFLTAGGAPQTPPSAPVMLIGASIAGEPFPFGARPPSTRLGLSGPSASDGAETRSASRVEQPAIARQSVAITNRGNTSFRSAAPP